MRKLQWTYETEGTATEATWEGGSVPIVRMHDPEGIDLRSTGYYRERKAPPEACVLHWPGNTVATAKRAARMFLKSKVAVSTHFTVDHERIMQLLPLHDVAFHCGAGNQRTIGIDICQPQTDLERATEWGFQPWGPGGYDQQAINAAANRNIEAQRQAAEEWKRTNPGEPQPRRRKGDDFSELKRYGRLTYLPLDPRVARNVAALLHMLEGDGLKIYFRPFRYWTQPRKTVDAWLDNGWTVIHHGDLPGTKIDALPWHLDVHAAYYSADFALNF